MHDSVSPPRAPPHLTPLTQDLKHNCKVPARQLGGGVCGSGTLDGRLRCHYVTANAWLLTGTGVSSPPSGASSAVPTPELHWEGPQPQLRPHCPTQPSSQMHRRRAVCRKSTSGELHQGDPKQSLLEASNLHQQEADFAVQTCAGMPSRAISSVAIKDKDLLLRAKLRAGRSGNRSRSRGSDQVTCSLAQAGRPFYPGFFL